jgi:glutamine synthetase
VKIRTRDNVNIFSGGDGPHGLTEAAHDFIAGIFDGLPALLAIGAPSVASYLRLIPRHWSGPHQALGLENRETALRFITGSPAHRAMRVRRIWRSRPLTRRPIVAGLIFAGLDRSAQLPDPVNVDPATLDEDQRPCQSQA